MEEETTETTLELLESRLKRVEFLIYGHTNSSSCVENTELSPAHRLRNLELGLQQLRRQSLTISQLIGLQAAHPEFFSDENDAHGTPQLDQATKEAIVLSSAPLYSSTASSLRSIQDTPVPDAETSARIIQTRPQVEKLQAAQHQQLETVAALKARTAAILQRWYSVDILQTGEFWAETESRLDKMDQKFRRMEAAKASID